MEMLFVAVVRFMDEGMKKAAPPGFCGPRTQ